MIEGGKERDMPVVPIQNTSIDGTGRSGYEREGKRRGLLSKLACLLPYSLFQGKVQARCFRLLGIIPTSDQKRSQCQFRKTRQTKRHGPRDLHSLESPGQEVAL